MVHILAECLLFCGPTLAMNFMDHYPRLILAWFGSFSLALRAGTLKS